MTIYRTNADGSAVCPHRDLSVCPECATDPAMVEVFGAHYYLPDPVERAILLAELHDGFGRPPVSGDRVLFTAESGRAELGTVEYVTPAGGARVHFDDDTYTTIPAHRLEVLA